jgi:hypothetical protein
MERSKTYMESGAVFCRKLDGLAKFWNHVDMCSESSSSRIYGFPLQQSSSNSWAWELLLRPFLGGWEICGYISKIGEPVPMFFSSKKF